MYRPSRLLACFAVTAATCSNCPVSSALLQPGRALSARMQQGKGGSTAAYSLARGCRGKGLPSCIADVGKASSLGEIAAVAMHFATAGTGFVRQLEVGRHPHVSDAVEVGENVQVGFVDHVSQSMYLLDVSIAQKLPFDHDPEVFLVHPIDRAPGSKIDSRSPPPLPASYSSISRL